MLSKEIVNEFMRTLEPFASNEIEISILDVSGGLIYSTNKARGQYTRHDIKLADCLENNQPSFCLDGCAGVTSSVFVKGRVLAYIVVLGAVNEILTIANILKMAMEIRLKYDEGFQKSREERSLNGRILKEMFEVSPIHFVTLKALFEKGNFRLDLPRIPLVFEAGDIDDIGIIEHTSFYFDSHQDIVSTYDRHVVILKDSSRAGFSDGGSCRLYINSYLKHIRKNTVMAGRAFIGNCGRTPEQLRTCYGQILWMRDNLQYFTQTDSAGDYFFKDYFDIYMMGQVGFETYDAVFGDLLDNKELNLKDFMTIVPVLIKNNYNMTQSSKELYMHKNTLLYKIEQFKKVLSIDPVNVEADRFFLKSLYFYFMMRQVRKE